MIMLCKRLIGKNQLPLDNERLTEIARTCGVAPLHLFEGRSLKWAGIEAQGDRNAMLAVLRGGRPPRKLPLEQMRRQGITERDVIETLKECENDHQRALFLFMLASGHFCKEGSEI